MISTGKIISLIMVLGLLVSCNQVEPRKARKGCLDCHPELVDKYATGKVHKPVADGQCRKCHRPHGMVGGVYLKSPQPELCFSCHRELKEELKKIKPERLHKPLTQNKCTYCHQPHNAGNDFLLDKPVAKSCFACHDEARFRKANQHQPLLEGGCQTCHDAHGTAFADMLAAPPDTTCKSCHELEDKAFIASHAGYRVTSGCLGCHDVHSSDKPALLRSELHPPTAELACGECHFEPGAKDPFALKKEADQLCAGCHDVKAGALADPRAHPPVSQGKCLDCHAPHASDYRGMTIKDTGSLCLDCHQFNGLEVGPRGVQKKGLAPLHDPLLQGDCLACHNAHQPHAGEDNLLRDNPDKLCLNCHDSFSTEPLVKHPPTLQCHTCHQPHESEEPGLLRRSQRRLCSSCHENIMEEFSLNSQHRPFVAGDCSACHTPHGGKYAKLLQTSPEMLCQRCHQKTADERNQAHRHQPFKEGNCRQCHKVHSSSEPYLLTGNGETLCLGCHEDLRPTAADTVVHAPVSGFNCIACHNGHGLDRDAYLLQDKPALCLRCHDIDRDWKKGRGHQPAQTGDCEACHLSHFGSRPQLLRDTPFGLCAKCHELDQKAFKASHQGVGWGKKDCLSCHDPHGAPAPGEGLLLPYRHQPFADQECSSCHGGNS